MHSTSPATSVSSHGSSTSFKTLALGALGVVFGDIGTSPLYAIKECFFGSHSVPSTHDNVLGVLSLVFWSLVMVVSVKYLGFIMKADNKGEGGIFALLALIPASTGRIRITVAILAIFGAALLYSDGVITPAISILSAMEGLEVATEGLRKAVVPLTVLILVGVFLVQKKGTEGIGRVFGPVMVIWFATIGLLGLRTIFNHPEVLHALNPWYAGKFFATNGGHAFVVLGSVVLCITGGEALYADMGHFGRRPIRFTWYAITLPGLLLNYFGQGALLLDPTASVTNPFYGLVPQALLYPMVALSTMATVIASQAMISGAFSLTRQAVQLGYCPRVTIVHTSTENEGQIYIPEVNVAMMISCLALVLVFQESSRLAAAYGIAVTGSMAITSIVYYFVVTRLWKWSPWKAAPAVVAFLAFDLAYFGANALKLFAGGWLPMAFAAALFTVMTTWKRGRRELGERVVQSTMPLDIFLVDVGETKPHRVSGSAIFMSSNLEGVPPVLMHHLKHNKVLHETVVLLSITSEPDPQVPVQRQVQVKELDHGFYKVHAHFGFMQTPKVPDILRNCRKHGLKVDPATSTFYLGRETLLTGGKSRMARWRKWLFAFIARNARSATAYFDIPPGRVVELGMQIDL